MQSLVKGSFRTKRVALTVLVLMATTEQWFRGQNLTTIGMRSIWWQRSVYQQPVMWTAALEMVWNAVAVMVLEVKSPGKGLEQREVAGLHRAR